MKTPDRIWLVNLGDEVIWHDDPKPTGYEEPQDSVEYVRVGGQTAAELEALRRDAERYRWLSNQATQQADARGPIFRIDVRRNMEDRTLFNVDAAIDAAIAQQEPSHENQ